MITYILGSVQLFPYYGAPQGWMLCDGRRLPIASFQALFSLIGPIYGEDGTSFSLPDYKNDAPEAHMAYYICVEGEYPVRN